MIGVVGLGYVGLPLVQLLSRKFDVYGYDYSSSRISEIHEGLDRTEELSSEELNHLLGRCVFTNDIEDLRSCNIYIVCVPTPITDDKKPDLSHLKSASESVGSIISINDLVIFESTVYPGVTEDYCAPILAEISGLEFNKSFFCGYSPERVNPGDKTKKLKDIIKITSGSTSDAADLVDFVYNQVIDAGTHRASSIRIAESAKVIENIQRDLNIALINELTQLFHNLEIPFYDVLEAAKTKWNFLDFSPGLVGGHCIGIDPYYLTYCASENGFEPSLTLAGRRINESMPKFLADLFIEKLESRKNQASNRILVLGITFKENCPDTRNSKVIDLVRNIERLHFKVDIVDPLVDPSMHQTLNLIAIDDIHLENYAGIFIAVPHNAFRKLGDELTRYRNGGGFVLDFKCLFSDSYGFERL